LVQAILLASNLIQVGAPACPPAHTEVRVSEDIKPPQIDESKTNEQLKSMTVKDAVTTDPKFTENGVTTATIAVDSEIRTKSSGPESGPVCVSPSVISIKVSTAPNVYIDGSHGACRQNVFLGHEMGHVVIDKTLIDRFLPIFRARVAEMADAIGSVPASSYDDSSAVRARMEEKINAMLSVTYDSMAIERALAHREHDSPDEYRRVSTACPPVTVNAPDTRPMPLSRNGSF
jgi:hypothetical protein